MNQNQYDKMIISGQNYLKSPLGMLHRNETFAENIEKYQNNFKFATSTRTAISNVISIGSRVAMYWKLDHKWYSGSIIDSSTSKTVCCSRYH